jgi:hypothetical protein
VKSRFCINESYFGGAESCFCGVKNYFCGAESFGGGGKIRVRGV